MQRSELISELKTVGEGEQMRNRDNENIQPLGGGAYIKSGCGTGYGPYVGNEFYESFGEVAAFELPTLTMGHKIMIAVVVAVIAVIGYRMMMQGAGGPPAAIGLAAPLEQAKRARFIPEGTATPALNAMLATANATGSHGMSAVFT